MIGKKIYTDVFKAVLLSSLCASSALAANEFTGSLSINNAQVLNTQASNATVPSVEINHPVMYTITNATGNAFYKVYVSGGLPKHFVQEDVAGQINCPTSAAQGITLLAGATCKLSGYFTAASPYQPNGSVHWNVLVDYSTDAKSAPTTSEQLALSSMGVSQPVYVFGDSLSDMGNINAMNLTGPYTNNIEPTTPVNKDAKTWADYLAVAFGNDGIKASEQCDGEPKICGTDFAVGGAVAGPLPAGFEGFQATLLSSELDKFFAIHPGKIDSNAVYAIWAGGNNLLYPALLAPEKITDDYLKDSVIAINESVGRLKEMGATQIVVFNLPPVGNVPAFKEQTALRDTLNERVIYFNNQLQTAIDELNRANPQHPVKLIDIHKIFANYIAAFKPGEPYGPGNDIFQNITDNCYAEAGSNDPSMDPTQNVIRNACKEQNGDWFYFDAVHPSGKAHKFIWNNIKAEFAGL